MKTLFVALLLLTTTLSAGELVIRTDRKDCKGLQKIERGYINIDKIVSIERSPGFNDSYHIKASNFNQTIVVEYYIVYITRDSKQCIYYKD